MRRMATAATRGPVNAKSFEDIIASLLWQGGQHVVKDGEGHHEEDLWGADSQNEQPEVWARLPATLGREAFEEPDDPHRLVVEYGVFGYKVVEEYQQEPPDEVEEGDPQDVDDVGRPG